MQLDALGRNIVPALYRSEVVMAAITRFAARLSCRSGSDEVASATVVEERANVIHPLRWLFQRGEVPASRHDLEMVWNVNRERNDAGGISDSSGRGSVASP
jgi:hypothetical protein